MTELIEAIILGIVQGLTEFLPVSSSGHLEIAKALLGDDSVGSESLLMTVSLHAATALSTIIVFWKDVKNILLRCFKESGDVERSFVLKILISMIPAVIVGLFFDELIESLFNKRLILVACMLFITASLLLVADRAKNTIQSVGFSQSLLIGLAQAVAIIPGISRSGATISASVLLGIDREKAARFSFLMVVPLIFGKMIKDIMDGSLANYSEGLLSLGFGFMAALLTGIFACRLMIKLVKRSQLKYFAMYCIVVASALIVYVNVT